MGQKLRLANWKLMQTNSHMLAELNLGRDRNWRFGDAPIVAGNSVGQNCISAPGHCCSTSSAFKEQIR
uniref:Uncharacterized protein n=1 Tax=Oryza punctata TaxID=4537 RepID=A0A0E0K418_ORYPU